jgi:mevalonate kinase
LKKVYHSNGKLLLTGEYVVLDGALSLAIPTAKGQTLEVATSHNNGLAWKSLNPDNSVWFETHFQFNEFSNSLLQDMSSASVRSTLLSILRTAKELNPSFLKNRKGVAVTTHLDFPKDWGLGSSSTLINNIAQWAEVDVYQLLQRSFGGSGYDVAVAQHSSPILYTINSGKPSVDKVEISWNFTDALFFVYLNKKQDSKEGIARYRNSEISTSEVISKISEVTQRLLSSTSLVEFESHLANHEAIISRTIGLPAIKPAQFSDYPGEIKSLGAWGGDFILATGEASHKNYFREKGYTTIIPFSEMIA